LGSKWSGAVNIFRILALAAFIQPVTGTVGLVLVSLGQSKRYFTIGTINSIILVISFILGLPWGAIGVAAAYTIATYVVLVPVLWYCFRRTPISMTDFFSAISRPMIAGLCMGGAIFPGYLSLRNQSDIMVVGACFVLGLLAYLLVWVLIPGGIQTLREFSSYRSFLFQKET
jgi:PST family polysaccharide transporter